MPTTAPMSTNVAQMPNYNMSTNAGPVVATQPKAVVAPAQTVAVPLIAAGVAGIGLTVTTCVALLLPQPLLMV